MDKRILALAVPNIITNIAIPLLGMVDMGLMGHLESGVYVGAVAVGTTIFSFLFWSFGFLRMGSSGFTAQAFGSRNLKESMMILYRSLGVGLAVGVIIILLQWPIQYVALRLINGSDAVETLARQYFYIRVYASPPTLCLYAFTGWFIGMQNSRIPMILSVSVNVMNILFSMMFIFWAGMKSNGIALANVFSQYLGLGLALLFFLSYYRKLLRYKPVMQWTASIRLFLTVNSDIFIRTICLILVLSFFTAKSAKQGDTLLAVNSLLFQLYYFFSYFIDGFAYAAEALTGRYIGARDRSSLVRLMRRLFLWGLCLSAPFSLIYAFGGRTILSLLTNHQEILSASRPYLVWISLVPLISFAAFLWDGIYVGATASKAMRNAMLFITIVVFFPVYYFLDKPFGNHGLWATLLIFLVSRGLILTILSKKSVLARAG